MQQKELENSLQNTSDDRIAGLCL